MSTVPSNLPGGVPIGNQRPNGTAVGNNTLPQSNNSNFPFNSTQAANSSTVPGNAFPNTALPLTSIPLDPKLMCFFSNTTGLPIFSTAEGKLLNEEPKCPKGFYCPFIDTANKQTEPTFCPASINCTLNRLYSQYCTDGKDGSQGPTEPIICPRGYVCPTPNEKKLCPAGHFCPSGTFEPIKCDFLSSCPEGTVKQTSYVGITIMGVLDIILLTIVLLRMMFEAKRVKKLDGKLPETEEKTSSPEKILTDAFKRSLNGRELKMNFKMDKLGYTLPNGKTILQGVSGPIRSSRMTAIMGPS
ncbi:hypothetical protein BC833DRAFT_153954, partial [Globomyces pollinis-pini]